MSSPVAFVGSVHMDVWIRTPRIARIGERVVGAEFHEHAGGKGAIQAVQASRLGTQVALIGALGDDLRGGELKSRLLSEAVELDGVRVVEGATTGASFICIAPDGQTSITVASGASSSLTAEDVDRVANLLADTRVLVLHCEMEEEVNLRVIEHTRRIPAQVILNAVPPERATPELLSATSVLIVNKAQARALLGKVPDDVSASGLARRLASRGPDNVVIMLGEKGALLFDGDEIVHFEAPVKPASIDPLGSEDAFVAAFAVRLAEESRLREAVLWGVAAATLVRSKEGAMLALPEREALEALVSRTPAGS